MDVLQTLETLKGSKIVHPETGEIGFVLSISAQLDNDGLEIICLMPSEQTQRYWRIIFSRSFLACEPQAVIEFMFRANAMLDKPLFKLLFDAS